MTFYVNELAFEIHLKCHVYSWNFIHLYAFEDKRIERQFWLNYLRILSWSAKSGNSISILSPTSTGSCAAFLSVSEYFFASVIININLNYILQFMLNSFQFYLFLLPFYCDLINSLSSRHLLVELFKSSAKVLKFQYKNFKKRLFFAKTKSNVKANKIWT